MNRIYSISKFVLPILFFSFARISCGGGGGGSSDSSGGGGGPPPIAYVGLTTPATITESNSEDMVFGSLLGVETGTSFALSAESQDKQSQNEQAKTISIHPNVIDFPLVLNNTSKNINFIVLKKYSLSTAVSAVRTATDIINGNCGGTATYTLNINDITGAYDGTFIFSKYCEDGIVILGDTNINGTVNLATGEIITISYVFESLTVDDFIYKGNVFVNDAVTPQIITLDLLAKDSGSDKVYWAKEYSILITEINATDSEIEVTGTYYDPGQGYVTVSTPEPLLVSTEDWPILGILLCVGDKNSKARLTAINESSYKIEADTDGDDICDYNSGVLNWPGSTPSAWQSRTSMPTPRYFLAAGATGGKIYAIGGFYSSDTVPLNTVEEYDPAFDVWNTKPPIPTARMRHAVEVLNGKIYAIGGRAPGYIITNVVEEFQPTAGNWITKTPMPTPRENLAATVLNGKIYAIGGRDGTSFLPTGVVEEYNPGTESWTTKASMPTPRFSLTACSANGKIYAIGGSSLSGALDVVEEYNPSTNSWNTKSSIPINRTEHVAVSVNEIIYLFGGSGTVFTGKEVEKYDPSIDKWTIKNSMPDGGTGFSAGVVNAKVYVIGVGDYLSGVGKFSKVYEYDPILDP